MGQCERAKRPETTTIRASLIFIKPPSTITGFDWKYRAPRARKLRASPDI